MLATTTIDSTLPPLSDAQQQEALAVKLALEGRFLPRARLALRALRRLMKDPNDTEQVFVLSVAMSARHFPHMLALFLSDERGALLFNRRAAIDKKSVDYDALRALPSTTLGGAYARFLDDRGLDPDLFQAPPGMPPGIAYVAQRMRQTHDLWHVVTGYNSDIEGELQLLAFTYGQTGAPSMRLLSSLGTLHYALRFGQFMFGKVFAGYRRGKRAPFMGNVVWEDMWHMPLAEVREQLGV